MRGGVNLENLFNYSTDETPIGTWLGKPLYRKLIQADVVADNQNHFISTNISGDIIGFKASLLNNNNQCLTLPYYIDSNNFGHINSLDNNGFTYRGCGEPFIGVLYIVVEYTKIID